MMPTNSTRRAVATAALLILAFAQPVMVGQTGANTGLRGLVTDASGAAIPGATVTITRVETGEHRVVTTNDSGEWEARFLSVGKYQLIFDLPGFKKLTRDGITVTTAEVGTVNAQLEVGEIGQTVQVSAQAEMVSSTSATVVRTLDNRELENLPTSSRNFTQLLMIEPGVSANISELLSNDNASISPSVNGARTTSNSFVFNGIDVTNMLCCNNRVNGARGTIEEGGGTLSRNIAPALETLEEVKLQTSLFDAATGRNGGGNFQLISKSGSNQFHGSLFHFFQNDKLIANEFFFNRARIARPALRRNEGGFTLGGPIVRNKTFFFGSYQLTRASTSFVDEANNTRRVPAALTDDRTDSGINAFATAIWPARSGPVNLSAINPISRSLLKAKFADGSYLIRSGNSGLDCRTVAPQLFPSCQVVSVIPATFEADQFTINIDHQLSGANKLAGKFFFSNQPSIDPLVSGSALTRNERNEATKQRTLSLTDVHVFGGSVINELRAGIFRNTNNSEPVGYFTNAEFGINNPFASQVPELSQINVAAGANGVGDPIRFGTPADGIGIYDVQNTFTYADTLSFTKGQHSLRVGGEYRRHQLNGDLREGRNRRHNTRTWFDFLTVGFRNPGDSNRARQISDTSLNYGETIRGFRMSDWNWFVADDWRITPNLTLNLGVRHEVFGFPYEVNGFLTTFDYPRALAAGAVSEGFIYASNFDPASVAGTAGLSLNKADSKTIVPTDYNNIMPRFGFAWAPGGSKKVVLRGGYGMFYERITGGFANSLRQSPPFFREVQLNNASDWNQIPRDVPAFPIPRFRIGFDGGDPQLEDPAEPGVEFEAFETQMVPPGLATPYIQQWSLNTQWEFRPNWLVEVGYVGTKGTKLLQMINANQAIDIDTIGFLPRAGVPGGGFIGNYYDVVGGRFVNSKTPPPSCDITRDPGRCVISAELRGLLLGLDEDEGANTLYSNSNSIYNSLQLSLIKRFSRNTSFNANYTFSRSIDIFSDEGKYQVEHDQTRPYLNRGLSDFHRKHRFITSWTWDLPFSGNRLVSGWQLSGVGILQSGTPFTIIDNNLSGFLYDSQNPRPNLAQGATHDNLVTEGSVNSRINRYLNRSAVVPSGAQFGNLGRNTVIGPDQRRLDVNLSKRTRLSEDYTLEFRAEAYNVTNTPSFRNPNRDIANASFGQITRTRGGPRVIQLGLKLRF